MDSKTVIDNTIKTALVTGGSRGIGNAICEALKNDGINVVAPSRSEMDLSNPESVNNYMSAYDKDTDIFIHCAGINPIAGIDDVNDEIINSAFNVNYLSAVNIIKSIVPVMKEKMRGHIVLISSLYALISRENRIAYSSSKNALNGLCKTLALELAPYNIMVNEVAPGYVMTDMTRKNLSDTEISKIEENIPTHRFQDASEIADMVAFLCSDKNKSITGQHIAVDGGFLCK